MTPIDLARVRRALRRDQEPLRPSGEGAFAAVAAVLRDAPGGAEVLLIRRAEHPEDPWSGHMAFPGGRYDSHDRDLLATAERETREEVGLDLGRDATLLGPLDPLPAVARGRRVGMTIAPFVFELTAEPRLAPNHEVIETLWAPLEALARGHGAKTIDYVLEGQTLTLPAWDVEGRTVWGLTYRMLQALLERLG